MLCLNILNLLLFNITLHYIYLAGSDGNQLVCTRKEIFIAIKDDWESDLNTQLTVLEKKFAEKTKIYFKIHPDKINELKKLLCHLKLRWKASSRKTERFFQQNKKWLNYSITVTVSNSFLYILYSVYIYFFILFYIYIYIFFLN